MTALLDPEFVAKTVSKRNNENLLKTKNEIILNTYWRFLQLREYIDKDTHELTPWGKALQSALAHTIAELEIEEAVVLGFELLRTKSVKFGTLPPGGSSKGPEDVRKHIFLISRIASLASLSHKSTGYTGPLSRPLLAFNSLANVTITALRSLVEAVLGSLLLGGDSEKVSRQDWFEISSALPFGHPANCAAGIAAKMYLDNFAGDESADIPDDVKEERKADLINMFRDAEDVEGDVDRSWMLWGAVGFTEFAREYQMLTKLDCQRCPDDPKGQYCCWPGRFVQGGRMADRQDINWRCSRSERGSMFPQTWYPITYNARTLEIIPRNQAWLPFKTHCFLQHIRECSIRMSAQDGPKLKL